jgi:hypothetical protein
VGFDEFGNSFGVLQHCQGLLEGFKILRADQDGRWSPVSGDYDSLVVFLHSFDEL